MAPAQEERIPIKSAADLAYYFQTIQDALAEKETEDSWQRLDKALSKMEAVTKGGGYKFDEFVYHMKSVAEPLTGALLSERTRLSGTAGDVLASVAPRMAERFEPLVNVYVPPLLQICARTNKVALKRAEKCLQLIARHCKLPNILPLLKEASKDKYAGLRAVSVACMVTLFESGATDRLYRKAAEVETMIGSMAKDPNPEVRQNCKKLFQVYIDLWPERVASYTAPLTPTTRRYLSLPKTGALQVEVSADRPVAAAPKAERAEPRRKHAVVAEDPSSDYFSGQETAQVKQPSPKREMFLEALAAAKSKKRPMPSTVPSTGALRSFSTASLFGGASRAEAEKSRPQQESETRRERHRAERTRSQDDEANANQMHRHPGHLTGAEAGPSRLHRTKSSAALRVPSSSSSAGLRSGHEGSDGTRRYDLLASDGVHPPLQRSVSSNDAGQGAAEGEGQLYRVSRTAPVTPMAPSDKDIASWQEEREATGSDGHPAAPSDRVAQRLAAMEQQERIKDAMRTAEEGCGAGTPGVSQAAMLPSKTPKALRVVMPTSAAPPTLQRQASAVRVAVPSVASPEALLVREVAPAAPVVVSKPAAAATTSGSSSSHAASSSKAAAPASKTAPVKSKPLTVPVKNPAKSPVKGSGKVASSTTQAITGKSRALGGESASSSVQRSAASHSAASKTIASKATTAQAAREAIVAKKQAEVAKMKAANRARAEAAASRDTAVQASKRNNVQRQKIAAGTALVNSQTTVNSAGPDSAHRPSDRSVDQSEAEQAASAAWDATSQSMAASLSAHEPPKTPRRQEMQSSEDRAVLQELYEDRAACPVQHEEALPVQVCQLREERTAGVTEYCRAATPSTPSRRGMSNQVGPSPARTPLGSLTPNVKNATPAFKCVSSPVKTPSKFTPSRHNLSSPADKLLRRDQLLQQAENGENIFFETAPLRLSPLKSRPITPRSVVRGTQFRPRQATGNETESDEEEDAAQRSRSSPFKSSSRHQTPVKSAVPRHLLTPFSARHNRAGGEEYDSSASSMGDVVSLSVKKNSSRLQLICGREGVDADAETDVERLISF